MTYQLKTRQVCFFFIAFVPAIKFFTLPSVLAKSAGEAMWVSALICFLLDLFTIIALTYTMRKTRLAFYGLLELNFGKIGAKIILVLYLIFFLMKSIIPINEQKEYIEITLYETMPNAFTFFPLFFATFYFCLKSKRVIGRVSDVLWIISLLGMFIIFFLSFLTADFSAMLPLFSKNPLTVFKGAYHGLNWYGDGAYFMFLIGDFAYKKKDSVKIIFSYVASGLAVLMFIILFYCIFTSISFRQLFALTEVSKYSYIVSNIGRFDYLGIMNILFASVFSLGLPLYFSTEILTKVFNFKNKWIPALIVNLGMLLLNLLLTQYFATVEHIVLNFAGIFFLVMGNVLPILTTIFRKKERATLNEIS